MTTPTVTTIIPVPARVPTPDALADRVLASGYFGGIAMEQRVSVPDMRACIEATLAALRDEQSPLWEEMTDRAARVWLENQTRDWTHVGEWSWAGALDIHRDVARSHVRLLVRAALGGPA